MKTTQGEIDDYKSMAEVLRRRLNYLPEVLPEGYKIRKAKKADFKFIETTCKKEPISAEDLNVKQFYVIEKTDKKKKTIVAFARIFVYEEKIHEIRRIHPDDNQVKQAASIIKTSKKPIIISIG